MKPEVRAALWGVAAALLLIAVLVFIFARNPGAWITP